MKVIETAIIVPLILFVFTAYICVIFRLMRENERDCCTAAEMIETINMREVLTTETERQE